MEIDYDYHKGPRFKGGGWLPFIIKKEPIEWSGEYIKSRSNYYLKVAGSEIKLCKPSEKTGILFEAKFYLGVCLFFCALIPLLGMIGYFKSFETWYLFVLFIIGFPFIIPAYKKYNTYKNHVDHIYVTFDRENSLITLPKMDQSKYFTVPFSHLKAVVRSVGARYSYSGPELHFMVEPRAWRPWRHFDYITMGWQDDAKKLWYLYVWYMDKNRPLPPGSAFDEYRDEDFNRRKTEGFPLPLFKSMIPTPESTKEQQTEREKYWKDEEYMVS